MNVKITESNYEVFALDYLDNQLSPLKKARFEEFLNNHPSIKTEIETLTIHTLSPEDETVYPFKKDLFKPHTSLSLNYIRVAFLILLFAMAGFLWQSNNGISLLPHDTNIAAIKPSDIPNACDFVENNLHETKVLLKDTSVTEQFKFHEKKSISNKPEEGNLMAISKNIAIQNNNSRLSKSLVDLDTRISKNNSQFKTSKPENIKSFFNRNEVKIISNSISLVRAQILKTDTLTQINRFIQSQSQIIKVPIDIALITDIGNDENGYFGKWAFAKTKISLVPSYFNAD